MGHPEGRGCAPTLKFSGSIFLTREEASAKNQPNQRRNGHGPLDPRPNTVWWISGWVLPGRPRFFQKCLTLTSLNTFPEKPRDRSGATVTRLDYVVIYKGRVQIISHAQILSFNHYLPNQKTPLQVPRSWITGDFRYRPYLMISCNSSYFKSHSATWSRKNFWTYSSLLGEGVDGLHVCFFKSR
jgi:hypothetical protein